MSAPPARTQREFAREELEKELLYDYSTSGTGVVPPGERRSRWHFVALWITLAAGFTYLFLGFEYHRVGWPLAKAVAASALGALFYLCYAPPASYLGSRTGQTHAPLTRSIFGVVGSVLVSLLLIGVAAGWTAIALPCTTVVMCVDRFLLPRLLAVERPVEPILQWRDAGAANWPGIVAVLAALLFGAWGQQLFPGQTSAPSLGLVPVEAWVLAGVLYLALAAVAVRTAGGKALLGCARPLRREAGP
jgi:purine-cytosine permease-like protein